MIDTIDHEVPDSQQSIVSIGIDLVRIDKLVGD